MTVETGIVLQLCRTPLPTPNLARATAALEQPVSIEKLLGLARAWQVEPVVMGNLRREFAGILTAGQLSTVSERERDSRAVTLGRTLALVEIVRKFSASGIPAIVLKGPAIGVTGYGDPSLRPFADFDLLVRPEDMSRARDLTLSLGYRRDYLPENEKGLIQKLHALEFSRMSTKIELHCALLSRHLRFSLEPADVWRESVTIECGGSQIRVPAPHHQFLFVCAHGTKHRWVSPHWICDVAQLAHRMSDHDRDRVVALAAQLHARRILALSVRVARDLVGLDPDRFPDASLSPASETDALVETIRKQFLGTPEAVSPDEDPNLMLLRFWLSTRERWVDRAMSMAHVLFVPTEKDGPPGLAAWFVRPVRLGVRALRRASALA